MQAVESIYIKPKAKIGGFTLSRVYKVLAIGTDMNNQPVFTVADDENNIKNVGAERFKYISPLTAGPLPEGWRNSEDIEVNNSATMAPEYPPEEVETEEEDGIEVMIEDPEAEEEKPKPKKKGRPPKNTVTKKK